MKLLEDREWPDELRAELERQIGAADPSDILRAASMSPAVGRSFRRDKTNLPRFRRNLVALALANPSESDLEAIRWCTYWKDVVCVLSTRALTEGFDAMAAFTGGARLVVAMLVDPREAVRTRAQRFLASGAPFHPVPEDPEAARAKLAETFEPFVHAFSAATVAPQVTRIDRTDEDRERIRALTEQIAALTAERAAESQARREAERAAADAERSRKRIFAIATETAAELKNAGTICDAATKRIRELESEKTALRDELLRRDNELRTLTSFRDECFRLRERETQLAADNEALRADAAALRDRVAELESAGRADDEALLRANVATAVPDPPRATERDLLAGMAYPDPFPAGAPLRLVIDGHNVLNVAPEYVAMATVGDDPPSHEALRADLQRRVIALADRLAPCEIDLHFDGPVDNLYRPASGIRVRFSGGTGDHRADSVALDELAFYIQQGGAEFITVTEDADFAAEALRLGSRTVRSGDFTRLLFG